MLGYTSKSYTFVDAHDAVCDLISKLEKHGVRIPPYGRVREYQRQLAMAAEVVTSRRGAEKIKLDHLHRALLEVADFNFVVDQLGAAGHVAKSLRVAMSGGIRPRDEKKLSSARDVQFELLIAALFKRAGYDVHLDEPDIRLAARGIEICVAAKRPRSIRNLKKVLKDADDQIRRAKTPGLIAFDVSVLMNPEDRFLPASDNGREFIKQRLDQFAKATHTEARGHVEPSRTIGYLVYGAILAADITQPTFAVSRGSVFGNFIPFSDTRMGLLRELRERVTCAI